MVDGVADRPHAWWRGFNGGSFRDRMVAGAIGFGNVVTRDVDYGVEGMLWATDKSVKGLSKVGLAPAAASESLHRGYEGVVARDAARHGAVDAEYADSTAYRVGGVAGHVAEFAALEVATAGVGGVAAGAVGATVAAARATRVVGMAARLLPKGAEVVKAAEVVKVAEVVKGAEVASTAAEVGGSGLKAARGVKGMGIGSLFMRGARVAGHAADAADVAKGAVELSEGLGRRMFRKAGRGVVGGSKAVGRGMFGMAGNFAGGAMYSAGNAAGSVVGGTVGMAAKVFMLFEAYKMFVAYLRGNDGVNGGEGVHTSAAVAKANAEKARTDLAASMDVKGPAAAAAGLPGVDRFGSVASAPLPLGVMDAQKREAYGMGRIQPASSINFDQTATITNTVNGNKTTTVLPYLRGASDGETLQRSAEWWNGQAKSGLVSPIAEGSAITVGQGRSARSYVVKDGAFQNVDAELGRGLPPNARSLSPADLARASTSPGLSSGKVLAAGLGGSDAKALDETTRGQVFASVDAGGARRITATEVPADGAGRSVFSLAVGKDGEGSMSATRFSKVGSMAVEDTAVRGSGRALGLDASGRITADASAMERAGSLGRSVGGDDLVRSLRGLRDGEAKVTRTGEPESRSSVAFQGHDRGGFLVRGGMSVENGKATMQVYGEDGKTPLWSRSVSDPGFGVGPDGKVMLSGRARELSEGFMSDPKGEARRLEGMGRSEGAMDRLAAVSALRDTGDAGVGASAPAPARSAGRSAGREM